MGCSFSKAEVRVEAGQAVVVLNCDCWKPRCLWPRTRQRRCRPCLPLSRRAHTSSHAAAAQGARSQKRDDRTTKQASLQQGSSVLPPTQLVVPPCLPVVPSEEEERRRLQACLAGVPAAFAWTVPHACLPEPPSCITQTMCCTEHLPAPRFLPRPKALVDCRVLDTPAERQYDTVTGLLQQIFKARPCLGANPVACQHRRPRRAAQASAGTGRGTDGSPAGTPSQPYALGDWRGLSCCPSCGGSSHCAGAGGGGGADWRGPALVQINPGPGVQRRWVPICGSPH